MPMVKIDKKPLLELYFGEGIFAVQIWWSEHSQGYCYDGPVDNGPKHVRESGRGPHWAGDVDNGYVRTVVRLLKKMEFEYRAVFQEAP